MKFKCATCEGHFSLDKAEGVDQVTCPHCRMETPLVRIPEMPRSVAVAVAKQRTAEAQRLEDMAASWITAAKGVAWLGVLALLLAFGLVVSDSGGDAPGVCVGGFSLLALAIPFYFITQIVHIRRLLVLKSGD